MLDPLDYPYVPVAGPGALGADGFVPGPVDGAGEALLAVGSNGCAEVLQRKLLGPVEPLPMAPGTIGDLAIGHSAHVSLAGYLAAAPYRLLGARTDAVVLWPSAEQLAAIDATEPSYERVWLSAERYPLWAGTLRPAGCWVYTTRFGLLTDAARRPVPLRSQIEVHDLLRDLPEIADLFGVAGPVEVARLLGSPAAQGLIDGALRAHGRTVPAAL